RTQPIAAKRLNGGPSWAKRHDEDMALQLAPEEPEAGSWRVELLSTVVNAVTRRGPDRSSSGRPAVLAVDVRSNSGNTTLAARIRELVPGSIVVHTNDIAWEHSASAGPACWLTGSLSPCATARRSVTGRRDGTTTAGTDRSRFRPAAPLLI